MYFTKVKDQLVLIEEIKRIMLPEKDSYDKKGSFKYFIEYINEVDAFPVPLCIKRPQMNGCIKYFDNNDKCINLLVHDKELLKNIVKYRVRLIIY